MSIRRAAPVIASLSVLAVAALALGACGSDGSDGDGGGGPTLAGTITIDGSVLTMPDVDTLTIPEMTLPDSVTLPDVTRP